MEKKWFVGIDVSKKTLIVQSSVWAVRKKKQFASRFRMMKQVSWIYVQESEVVRLKRTNWS